MSKSIYKCRRRKRLGQHFLEDPIIINDIVTSPRFDPQDNVVEIGPGKGALTLPLLDHLDRLSAIEYDEHIASKLDRICRSSTGELILYQADALKWDFRQLARNGQRLRLIGNLPYSIASPLLLHLMQHIAVIQDMHFMLQKEVVDRLIAPVGSRHYGRLSVMVGYYCKAEQLIQVGPKAFSPPPRVMSSVVRLTPNTLTGEHCVDSTHFEQVVKAAFSQKRKMLKNTLKGWISQNQLEQLGLSSTARAETLSVDQFIQLARALPPQQANYTGWNGSKRSIIA